MQYMTLAKIAEHIDVPLATLKQKIHVARKRGIPLPARRRVSKVYLYDVEEFTRWLWDNAEELRRNYVQTQPQTQKSNERG